MHWRRKWQPYPVFLPAESQGWQSLVGCRVYGVAQSQTWLKQLSSSSSSDSEAMLRQEWLFFLTYAWFGFIQMWVWFENYRLACIYRKKLLTLFQFMWEPNVIVQAKVHWNAQHKLNTVAVLSHFSHVWLFETLWTVACQAPLSMGILQARILEWVAMLSSRGIFQTQRSNPCLLCLPALTEGSFQ